MKKMVYVFLMIVASASVFAGGWTKERVSNTRTQVHFDGRLVADIKYYHGWKVYCEKRLSGSIRMIDDLDNAIQAAMSECSKNP